MRQMPEVQQVFDAEIERIIDADTLVVVRLGPCVACGGN